MQTFKVNFEGFSTELGLSLDYLPYLSFAFFTTLAKQNSPLLFIENKLLLYIVCTSVFYNVLFESGVRNREAFATTFDIERRRLLAFCVLQ